MGVYKMNKNISLKEGNQARNFTPEKLKTALQGGGFCLWVPKDGTRLKTISIRKPGTYQAWVEDVYGYSKATVSGLLKESEIKTISKEITENSTYRAEDEGFYGYDVVSVNVPGGGGTAPPSYAPGSSVVGTYPDDDEPVTVSVDDEGNLIKAGLADHILLDTPPDKLTYHDGERITLAGAVVRGYLKNGVPYKNASYQDSILPLYQYIDTGGDEIPGGIVFPVPLYAKKTDEDDRIDTEIDIAPYPNPFKYGSSSQITIGTLRSVASKNCVCTGARLLDGNNERFVIVLASETPFTYNYYVGNTLISQDNPCLSVNISEKVAYYITSNGTSTYDESISPVYHDLDSLEDINRIDAEKVAWALIYGTKSGGKQIITLTWPREGDRKHLTTTYEIQVTP